MSARSAPELSCCNVGVRMGKCVGRAFCSRMGARRAGGSIKELSVLLQFRGWCSQVKESYVCVLLTGRPLVCV